MAKASHLHTAKVLLQGPFPMKGGQQHVQHMEGSVNPQGGTGNTRPARLKLHIIMTMLVLPDCIAPAQGLQGCGAVLRALLSITAIFATRKGSD
jgi:hypothetical protein